MIHLIMMVKKSVSFGRSTSPTPPHRAPPEGYSVSIVGYIVRDGHVEYKLKIENPQGYARIINKRYREIRELHDHMKLKYPKELLRFPSKRLFGNIDERFVSMRQRELQAYLQHLLTVEPRCETPVLHRFLKLHIGFPQKEAKVREQQSLKTSVDSILAFAKNSMIDLSMPLNSFLDANTIEHRTESYMALLSDPAVTAVVLESFSTNLYKQPTLLPTRLESPHLEGNTHSPSADRRSVYSTSSKASFNPPYYSETLGTITTLSLDEGSSSEPLSIRSMALDINIFAMSLPPMLPHGWSYPMDTSIEARMTAPSIMKSTNALAVMYQCLNELLFHITKKHVEIETLLAPFPAVPEQLDPPT